MIVERERERERERDCEEYIGVDDHSLGEMSIQQGQQMILPFRLNMFDVGEAKPQNLHKHLLVFVCNIVSSECI